MMHAAAANAKADTTFKCQILLHTFCAHDMRDVLYHLRRNHFATNTVLYLNDVWHNFWGQFSSQQKDLTYVLVPTKKSTTNRIRIWNL